MLVSILIPTRERAETLRSTLKAVTAIDDASLEIIVSDNASTDDTADAVRAASDPRIRLIRTPERVSQRANFEHAVSAARGDYLLMIGDDDSVLPGQWLLLRALIEAERPAALSWPALFYHWPGEEKRGGGGRLRLSQKTLFGAPFWRTGAEHLASVQTLERSREDLSPKLYHGLLSRGVVEGLRSKAGMVVGSGQVDAYISAAALPFLERYLVLRHPFSILGMGPKSGGSSVAAQHRHEDANDSAIRVAEEAAADPVTEPLAMPFPVLGFYLLNGLEQANRLVHDGRLGLDYTAYSRMITDQLASVGQEARLHGLALLERFEASQPASAPDATARAARRARLLALPSPKPFRPALPFQKRLESLSLLEPGRIGIDLKPRGLADIAGATRMADYILGESGSLPFREADATARWRAAQKRALGVIFAGRGPA